MKLDPYIYASQICYTYSIWVYMLYIYAIYLVGWCIYLAYIKAYMFILVHFMWV